MEAIVGTQRFTTVGNVLPTGTSLRLYSLDFTSTISTSNITLYNGLHSGTGLLYIRCTSDSQGIGTFSWTEGLLFDQGIWLDTGAAGTITTIVGYSRSQA